MRFTNTNIQELLDASKSFSLVRRKWQARADHQPDCGTLEKHLSNTSKGPGIHRDFSFQKATRRLYVEET